MNETCNDRNALFRKIHECEFMMIDLGLYLDTHPDCVQALNAFQKHRASYENMQSNTSVSMARSHSTV